MSQRSPSVAFLLAVLAFHSSCVQDVSSFQLTPPSRSTAVVPSFQFSTERQEAAEHKESMLRIEGGGIEHRLTGFHSNNNRRHLKYGTRLSASVGTEAVAAINGFFKAQPFLSAFMMCSVKSSAADLMVQTTAIVESSEDKDINHNRNLAFFLYGGLYQGMFLQFLYLNVYSKYLDGNVIGQVLSDVVLFGPFVTLPVAYIIRAFIDKQTLDYDEEICEETSNPLEFFRSGLRKYRHHITSQNLLIRYWSVWGPAQSLTFGVVPEHLRVPFVAFVSFFWMAILSTISSRNDSAAVSTTVVSDRQGRVSPQTMMMKRSM